MHKLETMQTFKTLNGNQLDAIEEDIVNSDSDKLATEEAEEAARPQKRGSATSSQKSSTKIQNKGAGGGEISPSTRGKNGLKTYKTMGVQRPQSSKAKTDGKFGKAMTMKKNGK